MTTAVAIFFTVVLFYCAYEWIWRGVVEALVLAFLCSIVLGAIFL